MKKSNFKSSRRTFSNSGRRRQLLKRVHLKMAARRQHYQGIELNEELAEAC